MKRKYKKHVYYTIVLKRNEKTINYVPQPPSVATLFIVTWPQTFSENKYSTFLDLKMSLRPATLSRLDKTSYRSKACERVFERHFLTKCV